MSMDDSTSFIDFMDDLLEEDILTEPDENFDFEVFHIPDIQGKTAQKDSSTLELPDEPNLDVPIIPECTSWQLFLDELFLGNYFLTYFVQSDGGSLRSQLLNAQEVLS